MVAAQSFITILCYILQIQLPYKNTYIHVRRLICYNRPMTIQAITPDEKTAYDAVVGHPLQTYEWGEFRERTGVKVIRCGIFEQDKLVSGFQLTIHKIPKT